MQDFGRRRGLARWRGAPGASAEGDDKMQKRLLPARPPVKLPFLADPAPQPSPAQASPEPFGGGLGAEQDGRPRPQARRRKILAWSAIVCVVVPTLLASLYYGLIAADQYAVEARFAVRGTNSSSSTDLLGVFSGIPTPGSTVTDSYILIDFMQSREMLDALESKVGIRQIYSRPAADFLARFDPSLSSEEFHKYWRKMIKANFDGSSQIVAVEVKAFTAEDAKLVATTILELSEELINELSARARADAVMHAQQEVKRMEYRLKATRTALRAFRDNQQEFDPVKNAESRFTIVAKLEEELSKAKARLASLRSFMSTDAPSVTVLKSEIKALEHQVEEERAKLGKGAEAAPHGQESLGGLVANYEELLVEREFSEKAYVSALSSLERARVEADRQQRYLASVVRPTLPQEALYPKRILATASFFFIAVVLWALGVLVAYAVRDHAL
jgi:capsular polysaccharide transport system permease protein